MSHHIVFYAPLWGEDEGGVHAAANEQQAIGRVFRIGQVRDALVHISPYLPVSPQISLYLPISPRISPYIPISPRISARCAMWSCTGSWPLARRTSRPSSS